MTTDEKYMRRALSLAGCGYGRTATNPMVGAVIVARGKIIGEGFHRRWGGPHAEVNAVNSVKEADRRLLPESTIYVTLEPCSHYGKTPPCAKLIIETGIPRIVVGTLDPFPKVAGRGVNMLHEAGREVIVGVLEKECRELNRRFMTAHELGRPYIQLKWAQSANGMMAASPGEPRHIFSSPLGTLLMHRERAMAAAIMVGVNTIIADNPRLDCRLWPGAEPIKLSRISPRIPENSIFMKSDHILRDRDESLIHFLERLYKEHGILSVMVEGGRVVLEEFLNEGLYDEIRVEIAPETLDSCVKAPNLPFNNIILKDIFFIRRNKLMIFRR